MRFWCTALVLFISPVFLAKGKADVVVGFEELTRFTGVSPAGGGQFYNGNDGSQQSNSDGWSSRGAHFSNSYTYVSDPNFSYDFWSGWAYSNVTNATSPGYLNQYASFPGGGSQGSSNYAIAFTGSEVNSSGRPIGEGSVISFATNMQITSVDLANTTYTALFAGQGLDGFAPEPSSLHRFSDGDFFRITVSGYSGANGGGTLLGSLDFDLINFNGAGTSDDFLQEGWGTFDLSSLGSIRSLRFATWSSKFSSFDDNLTFYGDVPNYVAVDNLRFSAVPEPSSIALMALAGAVFAWRKRKGKQRDICLGSGSHLL